MHCAPYDQWEFFLLFNGHWEFLFPFFPRLFHSLLRTCLPLWQANSQETVKESREKVMQTDRQQETCWILTKISSCHLRIKTIIFSSSCEQEHFFFFKQIHEIFSHWLCSGLTFCRQCFQMHFLARRFCIWINISLKFGGWGWGFGWWWWMCCTVAGPQSVRSSSQTWGQKGDVTAS